MNEILAYSRSRLMSVKAFVTASMVAALISSCAGGNTDRRSREEHQTEQTDGGGDGQGAAPNGAAGNRSLPANFARFLAEVHEPTCSACHGVLTGLPDWSDYEISHAACNSIRNLVVVNEVMPPSGVAFTDAQRSIVDEWTRAGCPRSATDPPGAGEGGMPPTSMRDAGGPSGSDVDCPSYVGVFLPIVHKPVCSNCHGVFSDIPDWGRASIAAGNCSLIGEAIQNGDMPPSSSSVMLTSDERSIVLRWVALGCPESDAQARSACNDSVVSDGGLANISVSLASWDREKGELRIEGEVSDTTVRLTAEFGGRSEILQNDDGRFRAEFTGVNRNPGRVRIVGSDGSSASVVVETE